MVSNSLLCLPSMGLHYKIRFSVPPRTQSRIRIDDILTGEQDRKLVWDVTVHPQSSILPTLDHIIARANVKLLGRYARNRPAWRAKRPPPVDQRRLRKGHHLRRKVATLIGDHPKAVPPSGRSVDDVETALTPAILQTEEPVAPP